MEPKELKDMHKFNPFRENELDELINVNSGSKEDLEKQEKIFRKLCEGFLDTVKFDETLEPLKKEDWNTTTSYDLWRYISLKYVEDIENSLIHQKERVKQTYIKRDSTYIVYESPLKYRTEISKEYRSHIAGYMLSNIIMLNGKIYESNTWKFIDESLLKSFILQNSNRLHLCNISDVSYTLDGYSFKKIPNSKHIIIRGVII